MTTDQYIAKLNRVISALQDGQPFVEAVLDTVRSQADRIFSKGIDGNGGAIGDYSDKELYVNPANSPRKFTPEGKTGETRFKNGNSHKTKYFTDYGAFKSTVGRGSKVNLLLFGNLQTAFLNGVNPPVSDGRGVTITVGIKSSTANPPGKIQGILNKYPTAFKLTQGERGTIVKRYGEILASSFVK